MYPKQRKNFLRRPRFDVGGRHKEKRIAIAKSWAKARDQEAVDPLISVARDTEDDARVRWEAVEALGVIGGEQASAALTAILADRTDQNLHPVAIAGLTRIGTERAVHALIDAWEYQQIAVERALRELGPEPTVDPLIETLGHSSPAMGERAAKMLGRLEGVIPHLISRLSHGDAEVREAAFKALVAVGEPAVRPLLAAVPTHPRMVDTLLRMKDVTRAVLKNASADEIPLLIVALGFEDREFRQIARERLSEIGQPAVPDLLRLSAEDDDGPSRAAEEILVEMGQRAIRPMALNLGDAKLGKKAVELIGRVGEPALSPLFEVLNDPDCADRDAVVELMCAISDMDRLALAQDRYIDRLPFLLPFAKYKLTSKLLSGDISFVEQMSWEDSSEELNAQALHYHDEKYQDVQTGIWHNGDQEPDPDQILPQLQRLAAIAPEFALPHYWLGQWYLLRLNDVEQAIHSFEQAARSQEYLYEHRKAKSYWWLGVSHGTPSPHFDYEESLRCFERTIELGWDEALVHQAIQMSAQGAIDQCIEEGQNPALFLAAMRKKVEALSAFVKRAPEREDAKEYLKESRDTLDRIEGDYARLGEEAAFVKIRSHLGRVKKEDEGRVEEPDQLMDVLVMVTIAESYSTDVAKLLKSQHVGPAIEKATEGIKLLEDKMESDPVLSPPMLGPYLFQLYVMRAAVYGSINSNSQALRDVRVASAMPAAYHDRQWDSVLWQVKMKIKSQIR
jgi:HEAT repeat protein